MKKYFFNSNKDTSHFNKSETKITGSKISWDELFISGPFSPIKEFFQVLRIAYEFISGFRKFHFVGPCVTFFGSARTPEGHSDYLKAKEFSAAVSQLGFTIMTGGGPGIMEAANRGAFEANGYSVSANISLPHEQTSNPYVHVSKTFKYFFIRKTMLLKYSFAYVFFPGGYGTLDEAAEALTLIATGKLNQFPLIFVGKDYWDGLQAWFKDTLLENKMIHPHELMFVKTTDDLQEALQTLQEAKKNHLKSFERSQRIKKYSF